MNGADEERVSTDRRESPWPRLVENIAELIALVAIVAISVYACGGPR